MKLEKMINDMGLETVLEKPFGACQVDIWCPEVNKAVEMDSPIHSKKRDQKRDEYLKEKFGIDTMRVTNIRDPELLNKLKWFLGVEGAEVCL